MSTSWEAFGKDEVSGIYWITGDRPIADIDAADDGTTTGRYTGESEPYIALVEIDFSPEKDGVFDVFPVSTDICGDWSEEYTITHILPFKMPTPPDRG